MALLDSVRYGSSTLLVYSTLGINPTEVGRDYVTSVVAALPITLVIVLVLTVVTGIALEALEEPLTRLKQPAANRLYKIVAVGVSLLAVLAMSAILVLEGRSNIKTCDSTQTHGGFTKCRMAGRPQSSIP